MWKLVIGIIVFIFVLLIIRAFIINRGNDGEENGRSRLRKFLDKCCFHR